MIKRELLEILACPKCKKKVELDEAGRYLICHDCKLKYPINEQDIPIMLIDRAETLES
ncbi:MAG: Trm112 family protein [Candidatus Latescibacterota bacterium]|nr:MAG: Trm112 family protein [Candidatus Latescibacterota bacterium]